MLSVINRKEHSSLQSPKAEETGESSLKHKSQVLLKILTLWSPDNAIEAFYEELNRATVKSLLVSKSHQSPNEWHEGVLMLTPQLPSALLRRKECTSSSFVCRW